MKKYEWVMLVTIICLSVFIFSGKAEQMQEKAFDNLVKQEIDKKWAN